MDDQVLFEQFHAAYDVEPRAGSFELLRATLVRLEVHPPRPRWRAPHLSGRSGKLLAAALVVALAIASAGALIAINKYIHQTVPAHTPPPQSQGLGAVGCASYCGVQPFLFVSTKIGWLIENRGQDVPPAGSGSVLFRTDDGGSHWRAMQSWGGWGVRILASPDGMELLVVTQPGQGPELHHSADGGAHWTAVSLPTGLANVDQVYFDSPREGWMLSSESTPTVGDLFHTTDGGAHWTLKRIAIDRAFGLDLAKGGQVVFNDSASGWYLVPGSWDIYSTQDGGATWRLQLIPRPPGVSSDWTAFVDQVHLFNNRVDGVLSLHVRYPGQLGPVAYQLQPYRYVYTTADGGGHWSNPTHSPSVEVREAGLLGPAFDDVSIAFIDATHWVAWPEPSALGAPPNAGFMHTSDAGKHWDVLPASSLQVINWFEFLDPTTGWALGADSAGGSLYETTDGGANWTSLSLPKVG